MAVEQLRQEYRALQSSEDAGSARLQAVAARRVAQLHMEVAAAGGKKGAVQWRAVELELAGGTLVVRDERGAVELLRTSARGAAAKKPGKSRKALPTGAPSFAFRVDEAAARSARFRLPPPACPTSHHTLPSALCCVSNE